MASQQIFRRMLLAIIPFGLAGVALYTTARMGDTPFRGRNRGDGWSGIGICSRGIS